MNWSKEWTTKPDGGYVYSGDDPLPPVTKVTFGVDIAKVDDKTILNAFEIKDGNIIRHIEAQVIGDLALEFDDSGWCMYHVPTLSKFDKAVPAIPCNYCIDETGKCFVDNCENCMNERVRKPDEYSYDKSALLNWMTKVQAEGMYPTAWQILRGLTPDNYDGKAQAAKDIIMKHCLATAVE